MPKIWLENGQFGVSEWRVTATGEPNNQCLWWCGWCGWCGNRPHIMAMMWMMGVWWGYDALAHHGHDVGCGPWCGRAIFTYYFIIGTLPNLLARTSPTYAEICYHIMGPWYVRNTVWCGWCGNAAHIMALMWAHIMEIEGPWCGRMMWMMCHDVDDVEKGPMMWMMWGFPPTSWPHHPHHSHDVCYVMMWEGFFDSLMPTTYWISALY
jgi:hypothetical protein